ncbi:MAG: HNH endonuclease [Deltaproteobacteria bacterium]|nr:HNH endonuclease [Deltaproteobacteria bacterium]
MSSTKKKKISLFQRGAAAAERYTGTSDLYMCPICGNAFNMSDLLTAKLTLEHIPPSSVGGKGIALTCETCNKTAGYTIDAAVSGRADVINFTNVIANSESSLGVKACLQIGEDSVNVQVLCEEDGTVNFLILGDSNNPCTVERTSAYMERLARDREGDGEVLHVVSRARYHGRMAQVGDLKTAFLAAFAAFGYRYALDPRLELVRSQILHPCEHIIDGWSVALNLPEDRQYMLMITESVTGVVVKLDKVGVILPWLESRSDFYGELARTYSPNERLQLNGKIVTWPTRLEMALDFYQSAYSEQKKGMDLISERK